MVARGIGMNCPPRPAPPCPAPHNTHHTAPRYSGMTPEMVDALAAKHHIYMTRNGRISMAGVNTKNVGRLAEAMHAVTSGKL